MKKYLMSAAFGLAVALGALASCSPSPESPSCRTNSTCEARHDDAPYCVSGRCVECISQYTCGGDAMCSGGSCVAKHH